MAKYNYYYDNYSIKEDIKNCLKIKNYTKRELAIMGGASLLGLAAAGILKAQGVGDLESTYPLIALYALCFFESNQTLKRLYESKSRVDALAKSIGEDKKEIVYDLLMRAELETTRIESCADGEVYRKTQINDFVVDGQIIASQEYNLYFDGSNTEIYSNAGVTSDLTSYKKTLK